MTWAISLTFWALSDGMCVLFEVRKGVLDFSSTSLDLHLWRTQGQACDGINEGWVRCRIILGTLVLLVETSWSSCKHFVFFPLLIEMFWKLFVPASVLFVIKKVSRFGVPDVCGGLPCLGLSILSVVLDKKGLNIKGVICPSEIKRHLGIFTGWSTTNGLLLLPLSKLPDSN